MAGANQNQDTLWWDYAYFQFTLRINNGLSVEQPIDGRLPACLLPLAEGFWSDIRAEHRQILLWDHYWMEKDAYKVLKKYCWDRAWPGPGKIGYLHIPQVELLQRDPDAVVVGSPVYGGPDKYSKTWDLFTPCKRPRTVGSHVAPLEPPLKKPRLI